MEISFHPRHYAHVPVFYWPWVWWQLFWLRGWAEATGREVIFEVAENGQVHVLLVSDDTRDLRSWLQAQQTVWRDHWTPMHDRSGEAHLCAIHYWMGRWMERAGGREVWVDGLGMLRPVPPFLDSG